MSKELEAFNEIIDKFAEQMMRANKESLTAINKTNAIEYLYRTPQVRLLQQALQRLQSLDNAKPSEALECLEEIRDFRYGKDKLLVCQTEMYNTIKNYILKSQEQEKVLEIVFKKKVNLQTFKDFDNVDDYNDFQKWSFMELTEEEFDLLKRWSI